MSALANLSVWFIPPAHFSNKEKDNIIVTGSLACGIPVSSLTTVLADSTRVHVHLYVYVHLCVLALFK